MQNNYPASACQVITGNNGSGVTSPYVGICSVGGQSTTVIRYHGGSYLEAAEQATAPGAGNYTEAVFRLDGCQDITVSDAFLYAKFGLAIFECLGAYGEVSVVNVHGCRSEQIGVTVGTGNPKFFVWVGGGAPASSGLATWTIRDSYLNQDLALIYCAHDMKISQIYITNNTYSGAGTSVECGYLLDSRIDNVPVNVYANSSRNVFTGLRSGIVIVGGSVGDLYLDCYAGIIGATTFQNAAGVLWVAGPDTPEGAVTAPIGSLFSRTNGSTSTTLYVKTSGTGNTGWTAK